MKRLELFYFLTLTAISLFLLTRFWDKPFWGHHDWNSAIWSLVAKNNLTYGIPCTRLGQATTAYPIQNCSELRFYMDHPPLITWLLTVSYAIFGWHEWAGRLPFIVATTISAALLYFLGKRFFSPFTGWLAGLFWMATPMFNYFGKAINHEPLVLLFVLMAVYSFFSWITTQKKQWFIWFLVSAFLTGISGWHGYLLYPFLTLVAAVKVKNKFFRSLWALGILLLTFLAHQLHTVLITGQFNFELFSQFLIRIGVSQQDPIQAQIINFSYPKFLLQETRWLTIYYTRFLLVCTGLWGLAFGLRRLKKQKISLSEVIILTLLAFGASVPLLFGQQAFIHDYLNFYLAPFLTLAAAAFIISLQKIFPKAIVIILGLLVTTGIFLERKSYLSVLQAGNGAQPYVQLAQQIVAKRTSSQIKFLLEADNFYNFAYPFLWYYAYGTYLDSATDSLESFKAKQNEYGSKYSYLITVKTHPVSQELSWYLETIFHKKEIDQQFTFYKLPATPAKIPRS